MSEYGRRLESYRAVAAAHECDALVLYGSPADDAPTRHLTGFSTWWGQSFAVLNGSGPPVLCTSAIAHGEPMHSNAQTTWVHDLRPAAGEQAGPASDGLLKQVAEALPTRGRIGFADVRAIPVSSFNCLAELRPGVTWVDCSDAVRRIRRIKSAEELALLRRLGVAVSAALMESLHTVSTSATELDVAAAAHAGCVRRGAEAMDFGCFALSGFRSMFKNAWPTDRRPRDGEVVVVDLGATIGGYRSDVSRNCFVGDPSAEARRAIDACVEARDAALAAIRPGVRGQDVVDAMSTVLAGRGMTAWDFSLCHGIGMHLIEAPYFNERSTVLESGMVFCVEPIVAPPDVGMLCIEDMVAVTESGYELLTPAPVMPVISTHTSPAGSTYEGE
nr:Xaa-Pro peptidase family protein [Phytoactinopolyspora alkaliphila]